MLQRALIIALIMTVKDIHHPKANAVSLHKKPETLLAIFNINYTMEAWGTEWKMQGGFTPILAISTAPITLAYNYYRIIRK